MDVAYYIRRLLQQPNAARARQYLQIGSGTGDITDGQNVGGGFEVFKDKVGDELRFRTLAAGSNVTITYVGDTISIAATAGSGEVNTASNVGTGIGLFKEKTGDDLRFKTLLPGVNVTIEEIGADEVRISATPDSGYPTPADPDCPLGIVSAPTIIPDFTSDPYLTLFADDDLDFVSSVNRPTGAVRNLVFIIESDGSPHTLDFHADWKFAGTKPASIAANTRAILSLMVHGPDEEHITAAWQVTS